MGIVTSTVVFAARLVWLVCAGLWLGTAYFLLALLMSPFGTLFGRSSGHIQRTTWRIMWFKPDGQ